MRYLVLALGLALGLAGGVPAAGAACTATGACPTLDACCGGTSCTLDGTITVTGSTCTLDLGTRDVTLSGTLSAGAGTLVIRAGSFHVTGRLTANGNPGGSVTITHPLGGTLRFVTVDGNGQIDVSGNGSGGTLTIDADGPVALTGGAGSALKAVGLDSTASGGSIDVESFLDAITIAIPVVVTSGANGLGGSLTLGAKKGLSLSAAADLRADGFGATMEIDAGGPILLQSGSNIQSNGPPGSESDGGEISLTGAKIDAFGTIQAAGGSSALTDGLGGSGGTIGLTGTHGPITVTLGTGVALLVDGALGGDAGEIDLMTDDAEDIGDITIGAIVSAQGQGTSGKEASAGLVSIDAGRHFTLATGKRIDVSAGAGEAGEVDIVAERGDIVLNGKVNGVGAASGGIVSIDGPRDVFVNADVLMAGMSSHVAGGGQIGASAGRNFLVASAVALDASGATTEPGGAIDLSAGQNLTISGGATVNAQGGSTAGAQGGNVRLRAGQSDTLGEFTGDLEIDGQVTTSGRATTGSLGATEIDLEGCNVKIAQGALVDSTGDTSSTNLVVGRQSITLNGKLLATAGNVVRYTSATAPSPSGTGSAVKPPFGPCPCDVGQPSLACCKKPPCTARNVPTGCLMPCPACGNGGQPEFPEECDPGNSTDRCAAHCDLHCRNETCAADTACRMTTCDPGLGCVTASKPDDTRCPDNTVCNGDETCRAGICVGGVALDCDDHNACTNDCDPVQGCTTTVVPAGQSCDDGDPCNGIETCAGDVCTPGTPPTCPDDGDPDTREVCDPKKDPICQHVKTPCTSAADCNDHNPCTTDSCVDAAGGGKVCHTAPVAAPGTGVPGCDDGKPCNGAEACVKGACQPGTPVVCASDGKLCTDDVCDPATGACINRPIAGCCEGPGDPACNDGNACTDDACEADHTCSHTNVTDCCTAAADCNDGNPCTADQCNVGTSRCAHTPTNEGQNCGDACSIGRGCQDGICSAGDVRPCPDDGDVCTDDFCDPVQGCVHPKIAGCCHTDAECDDRNACTTDACQDARCVHTRPTPACRPCAADTDCDGIFGRCAGQACSAGVCVSVPAVTCGAGQVCRLDGAGQAVCRCTTSQGCDDGNACNGAETCDASTGSCVAGTTPDCNDGDVCTDDRCDPTRGCVHDTPSGFAGVATHLQAVTSALAGLPASDVSNPLKKVIATKTGAIQAKLGAASDAAGHSVKREAKLLKAASTTLRKLVGTITKAANAKKPKISKTLADSIRARLACASGAVQGLQTSLTP